jgi:hypothetical protein
MPIIRAALRGLSTTLPDCLSLWPLVRCLCLPASQTTCLPACLDVNADALLLVWLLVSLAAHLPGCLWGWLAYVSQCLAA